jgi:hypothetical protein
MKLNPVFDDLNNPETFLNHFNELEQKRKEAEQMPRLPKVFELKESAFSYDLWEWKFNSNKEFKDFELSGLYHEGIREFLAFNAYFKRYLAKGTTIYLNQKSNVIDEVTDKLISDLIIDYINQYSEQTIEHKNKSYLLNPEALRNIWLKQSNSIINNRWLNNLDTHSTEILKDTREKGFLVFKNCYYEINKDGIFQKPLTELNEYCVWKKQVIDRDFIYTGDHNAGEFEKFAFNVCNQQDDRFLSLKSLIGYLLHDYFNPTDGKAAILYDEALTDTDKPQGGTGKGLIAQAIRKIRNTAKIDGKNYKSDDKFKWSNVSPYTQVVWIDETGKYFDFKDLFSCLTDGWQVERKFANKFDIAPEDSPKVLICSNQVLPIEGSSFLRRQFIVELSDYYSSKIITGTEKPIEDEHGILFSNDWSNDEWTKFYSFMMECLQLFLKDGLCNYDRKNVHLNRLMQSTSVEFFDYIKDNPPPQNKPFEIKPLYEDFKNTYLGNDSKFTQKTFTNWLKRYTNSNGYEWGEASRSKTGRQFIIKKVTR